MSDVMQIAAVGMLQSQQRLAAISLNAASATLPGYRRQVVAGRPFDAVLAMQEQTPLTRSVDLKSAQPVETGRALDVSIDGSDAFFALTDGEQTWLTRAGSFRLDADGVLVGEDGLRVLGAQGELRLPGSDVSIERDGRITHAGVNVASLQLFRANEPDSLQAARGALIAAPGGIHPIDAAELRVRASTLEASNTDSTREMLDLMALARQFESLSHIVKGYDEMLGRAIQKLSGG
jgi:flagellar basal-body rod protein FlgF